MSEETNNPCGHCKGTGREPYRDPDTGVIEYGENELCQNCDECFGTGIEGWTPMMEVDE